MRSVGGDWIRGEWLRPGPARCKRVQDRLAARETDVEMILAPDSEAVAESSASEQLSTDELAHLGGCLKCQVAQVQHRRLRRSLRGLHRIDGPVPDFADAVMSLIEDEVCSVEAGEQRIDETTSDVVDGLLGVGERGLRSIPGGRKTAAIGGIAAAAGAGAAVVVSRMASRAVS